MLHFGRRETLHSSPDDDAFKVLDDLTRLPLTFGTAGCEVGRSRFQRRASSEEPESAACNIEQHGSLSSMATEQRSPTESLRTSTPRPGGEEFALKSPTLRRLNKNQIVDCAEPYELQNEVGSAGPRTLEICVTSKDATRANEDLFGFEDANVGEHFLHLAPPMCDQIDRCSGVLT